MPSTRHKLDKIVEKIVEITSDREIAVKKREAAHLHVYLYHGPDIAEISEKDAADAIQDLINWINRKAKQYKLL